MASVYVERPFDELRAADWDAVINVDLRAAFLCARAAAPPCAARAAGASSASATGSPGAGGRGIAVSFPYYVAKAGIIGLTEALALELAGDNILVNADCSRPDPRPSRYDRR